MKTLEEIKNIVALYRDDIREKYKVKYLGVFGSYLRNEQTEESDIDILIEFNEPVGGFHLIATETFLTSILNQKVDLIPRKAVKGEFEKNILENLVSVII